MDLYKAKNVTFSLTHMREENSGTKQNIRSINNNKLTEL